jgi:predicted Fe-Mo cluster-binding NifX family protein
MNIAIVTEDGRTISQHFGRAPYYAVLTVEGGVITGRELRRKHAPHLTGGSAAGHSGSSPHGTDPAAQGRHDQMVAVISDCGTVIAGGMGRGAYDRFRSLGLQPLVTEVLDVETAAIACERGALEDRAERLD